MQTNSSQSIKESLGYFGYTLLETQSLSKDEKQELLDRMGDALVGDDGAREPVKLFNENGLIDSEEWEALDNLCDMVCWTPYLNLTSLLLSSCKRSLACNYSFQYAKQGCCATGAELFGSRWSFIDDNCAYVALRSLPH